ncbi:MAG: malto-oligosyltrehalose trehalohydrolase [Deltaproteobacteria bacterium]
MGSHLERRLGARVVAGGAAFSVWAPLQSPLAVHLVSGARVGLHPLHPKGGGVWAGLVEGAAPGDRYFLRVGETDRPDPRSRFQPEGVHGPSALVDPASFRWACASFQPPPLADLSIYELHIGTFSAAGTFEGAIPHLQGLRELGFGAIELMPVAEFPGNRNWGYDGVDLYAPHSGYGGPAGLVRLVDAAHAAGLAVLLDVVYNHLGPEGDYLGDFAPYFTERHRTAWGPALDLDGPAARPVRDYLVDNALSWLEDYRFDGLRLDAVHAIVDQSPTHLLRELTDRIGELSRRLGRRLHVIAESDENDSRLIQASEAGGHGLGAVWSDDFHHALHVLLTGERRGYYQDFGRVSDLADAMQHGFVYEGQWSSFRARPHGTMARALPADRFVICAQNHDQVGNRARGERLSALVPPEAERLSLAVLFFSPGVPLVFMGEEYGETAPFLYFTSHGDRALALAVEAGRREEFASFAWAGELPSPQAVETFERSKLDRTLRERPRHEGLFKLTRDLLALRAKYAALRDPLRSNCQVDPDERRRLLCVRRGLPGQRLLGLFSFAAVPELWEGYVPEGRWQLLLDGADARYGGPGASPSPLRGGFSEARLPPFGARIYCEIS